MVWCKWHWKIEILLLGDEVLEMFIRYETISPFNLSRRLAILEGFIEGL